MFRWSRLTTALLVTAIALLLWSAVIVVRDSTSASISFTPNKLIVEGDVGAQVPVDVELKNTGALSITVIGAYQICTTVCCIEASGLPTTLAPGANAVIHAVIQIGPAYGETFSWPIYTDDPTRSTIYLPIQCKPD